MAEREGLDEKGAGLEGDASGLKAGLPKRDGRQAAVGGDDDRVAPFVPDTAEQGAAWRAGSVRRTATGALQETRGGGSGRSRRGGGYADVGVQVEEDSVLERDFRKQLEASLREKAMMVAELEEGVAGLKSRLEVSVAPGGVCLRWCLFQGIV